jgi:hypothetical protein
MGSYVQPFTPVHEGSLTELVGINEKVDDDDYSGSIGVTVGAGSDNTRLVSGEILSVCLYSTEDGTGAVQEPTGKLIILDADPAVASGDTAMTAAEWVTVFGIINVAAADWVSDANGAAQFITDQPVPFHDLATLYFVWLHQSATALNSDAADDEQLEFNIWYRRDS